VPSVPFLFQFLKINGPWLLFFYFIYLFFKGKVTLEHSLETRPGGSTRYPTNPGLEPGRVEEKIREGKTWRGPVKNLVATRWLLFFFFTKTTSFWFKKIDPDDPVTGSKPEIRTLDQVGSENHTLEHSWRISYFFIGLMGYFTLELFVSWPTKICTINLINLVF
jgi:hypothetical protein